MRILAAATACALVALLAAGCFGGDPQEWTPIDSDHPGAAPVSASLRPVPEGAALSGATPRLTLGDYWIKRQTDESGQTLLFRNEVVAFESLDIEGIVYEAVRIERTVTVGNLTNTASTWLRTSDLAFLRTSEAASGPAESQFGQTSTSSPPCRGVYPLQAWSEALRSCKMRVVTRTPGQNQDRVHDVTYTLRVRGEEAILTPAGHFPSFRVETLYDVPGGSLTTVDWYSPRACDSVHQETPQATGTRTVDLLEYRCARGS